MSGNMIEYLKKKLQLDLYDLQKLLFSGLAYFFVIGSYSILRSFKTSIFLAFVGREYEPYAKIVGILITIPVILFYAKIIDRLKKHQAVYFFLGFYAVLTLLFAYLFIHPVYGVANTQPSPWRLLGWIFEIFMDLFQALVVGTFWSFVSSVSTPDFAGKNYSMIVVCSRIGGIFTTVLSWIILEHAALSTAISVSLPLIISAAFLIGACLSIYWLKKLVPQSHLHGYEAAYAADLKQEKSHKKTGILEGLKLIAQEPYLLGIFWLVFSFEVINIIFDYQMHVLMSIETNNHVMAMSKFMLLYTCSFQILGLVFALFGTSQMNKHFGVKTCLLVMPAMTILMAFLPIAYPQLLTLWIVQVVLRALNYSFNQPLREMLFIPTVKDIKFTSKAWIDSFGRTISKTSGSALNVFAVQASYLVIVCQSLFAIGLACSWGFAAILVGKKYIQTITNNEVIGGK